ncbi:MAG: carbohydrate kinase [Phormidesmis sp.]
MGRAICLGEILIDCFAEQSGVSRAEVKRWAPLPGGALANVACALVRLGSEADFVGAVGCDHWGDALVTLLNDMGVGQLGVQRRLKAPTRQVYIVSDEEGDRTFAGFSENDSTVFADAHLFADSLASDRFTHADFLVLGTLSLAFSDTRQSVERAVELANAHKVPIWVDVNWRPMFWPHPKDAPGRVYDLLKAVQFLKVSVSEADWLFGTQSPEMIARQLPHLKGVLVSAGAMGCRYQFQGIGGYVPGFAVDVEDPTGAGDAFTAGVVHQLMCRGLACLLDKRAAREVVVYASAVSALTTTRPGAIAGLPTPKEIEVFLYLNEASLKAPNN